MRNRVEKRRPAHQRRDRGQGAPVYEVRLTADDIEALACRIADLLQPARAPSLPRRLMTAAEVAQWWGVERSWVYAHAEELGTRRIGTGERPRLRFDPEEVSERIAALGGLKTCSGRASAAIAADSRGRSLSRRRRGIVVGQGTDGRAAHNRPRPGAEGEASTR